MPCATTHSHRSRIIRQNTVSVPRLGRASAGDPGRPSAGALAGFAGWLLTAIGATRHYALHEAVKHGRDERRMMNEKSSR